MSKSITRSALRYTTAVGSMLVIALAQSANAQTIDNNAQTKTEETASEGEIVVTGFRASLNKARDIKRDSNILVDSIVAEDIANFPDLNLAESLQRLPGVAINREAGEGRRISLRGLGSDFTRVQLNGMEALGNVDSPQDSRGQTTRDRAFDFNIFASELFTQIDVRKTFSAEQEEGGLAGVVNLTTAKPFDYDGFKFAVSAQAGTNTATEDFQPRVAALISQNWGTFGALVSVAYSKRKTEEQGYNTYRWRQLDASDSDISGLSQADQDLINSGESRFARGNRLSVWQSEQERLGITGALQWQPSDTLELTFDALYGKFTGERDELHIAARGAGSTWLGGGTTVDGVVYPDSTINALEIGANNAVEYLDVSGANIASETRRQETENTFQQYTLTGTWTPTDDLTVSALIGTETSDYKIPVSDKFYLETFGGVISDYTIDPFYGYNTYDFDTTDASLWRAHEIDFSEDYQQSSFDNIRLDVEYQLNPELSFKIGGSYRAFANSGFGRENNNVLRTEFEDGSVDDDVTSYALIFSDHADQSWTIVDFDAALQALGVIRDGGEDINVYDVQEDTYAIYGQFNFDSQLFGRPFRGNYGIRYYKTDVISSGIADVGEVTVTSSYDDILPSFNAILDVTDNFLIRVAGSKNLNRPSLGALAVNGSVSEENGEITVSVGNPGLDPYESTNFDLSLEYYFGETGYIAVAGFYKNIDGFIGTSTLLNVPYSQTGLPLDLLPGLTEDTVVAELSQPVNYEQTILTGLEFTAQADFLFLPAPFNNLGMVANLTLTDSELDYASPEEQADGISRIFELEGLSDLIFNATLYYEDDSWGARVSANYRSGYVQRGTPIGSEADSSGFNATTYVDFSAFYNVTKDIKVTLDVINITNEREEQYSDSAQRLYNSTTAGTTAFAGVTLQF